MAKEELKYNRRDALKVIGALAVPSGLATLLTGCSSQSSYRNSSGIYRGEYAKNSHSNPLLNPSSNSIKQQYLKYGFMEYPQELHELCKKFSKEGKVLEDILTRGGWVLAVLNDTLEFPLAAVAGFIGKITEGEKSERNWNNTMKYVFDGTFGGKTYNEIHSKLLRLKLNDAIKIAYDTETTKLGGHGKLILVGSSDALAIILPLIKHGNGNGAGAGPGPTPPDPF